MALTCFGLRAKIMWYKIFCRWKKLQEKPHCRQDFVTHTTLSNTPLRPKTSRSLPSNTHQILNFLSNSPADMQIPRILRGSFCLPSQDKCSKKTTPAYLRKHVFDCIFTGNGVKCSNNVCGTYCSQLEWVLIWEALKGSCRTQRRLRACICSAHQPLSSSGKEKVSPASQNTFQLFESPQCL